MTPSMDKGSDALKGLCPSQVHSWGSGDTLAWGGVPRSSLSVSSVAKGSLTPALLGLGEETEHLQVATVTQVAPEERHGQDSTRRKAEAFCNQEPGWGSAHFDVAWAKGSGNWK